ncbi:DNA polymerase beta domain protein region [Ferroglobus placidus DSM 10642]|uniref:DNA polymerase beta domain protein region n=1 Tax=Ferroglobus placidus (strain DSM 10642 / AEDII12DO) TaxID=589924 RepID=D3RXI7_FERPA|nr:nucleotidyltransferase domain-containing protein [Ferroglobus placidus]ADC65200.1 DNA polymerase beta domain protein region [Ferroglobus placidus DSM 10642]
MQEKQSLDKLKVAVKKLREHYDVHAVILFGSRARGDYKPWSDYDLLIIADFTERYLDRIGRLLEILDLGINLEPHPYTLNEALEMLKKGSPTILDALSEGIILFESKKFEVVKKAYEELLKKGLKKSKVSYVLPEKE